MIRLKQLLNPTIYLYEDNAGYSDHKAHNDISEKIYNGWLSLLNSISRKDVALNELSETELNKAINVGHQFLVNLHDVEMGHSIEAKIDVLLAVEKSHDFVIIQGAATNIHSNPTEVYLKVSENYTVNDVLDYSGYIETIAHHEAVHIIKHHQKMFQFSLNSSKVKDDKWIYKYYSHPSELHANIAQLNNELKFIKQKLVNISFVDALKQSKIWKRYNQSIFSKNSKLKNKMLSKLANYWNRL